MLQPLKLTLLITTFYFTETNAQLDFNFPKSSTETFDTTTETRSDHTFDATTGTLSESEQSPTEDELYWIPQAVREVAYYIRQHKFNEFDRRYHYNNTDVPTGYYGAFPRPPLRSLHWEVHAFCAASFVSCLEYLWKKVKQTGLRRDDDTAVIVVEQNWTRKTHLSQIRTTEEECKKLRKIDDVLANPFQGPIERFQFRVTASYYLCWYTMNEVPSLKHFNESCDNFAYCMSLGYGARNADYRVDDENPYSCALYSFCPDPCCQEMHYDHPDSCLNSPQNPCFTENPVEHRLCRISQVENVEFTDIILNRWNVTCDCPQKGFRWNSMYSICIDINECLEGLHDCDKTVQACLNLPGSFQCACKWGYSYNEEKKCVKDAILDVLKVAAAEEVKKKERKAQSLFKYIASWMLPKKNDEDSD